MTNITLHKELFDTEEGYETYTVEILKDEKQIGRADVIIPPQGENNEEVYVEWIGINDEERGKGYGTQVLQMLAQEYGFIYFAPCDERNKEMYERIAEEIGTYEDRYDGVDQGFGVYFMER